MDFTWAIEQMRDEKKVRIDYWDKDCYLQIIAGGLWMNTSLNGLGIVDKMPSFYVLEDRWELYQEKQDFNLSVIRDIETVSKNIKCAADELVKALEQIGKKLMNHA